jgi:hypothetical protein
MVSPAPAVAEILTVPVPQREPAVPVGADGIVVVVIVAVLLADIVEVQFTLPLVETICVIVMVFDPAVLKEAVEKLPEPAVVTVIDAVVEATVFEPVTL